MRRDLRHGFHLRLLALLCWVICGFGCRCEKEKPVEGKPVARLIKTAGDVGYRKAANLTWSSATSGMGLFHRDAVKTGAGSKAEISYLTGNRLELDEQSLVVIEAPPLEEIPSRSKEGTSAPVRQVAVVERGTVHGVAQPGAPPVRLVSKDGRSSEISAEGEDEVSFRVRVREAGSMEVAVLKGAARLRSGKRTVRVKALHVVDVKEGRPGVPVALPDFPVLLEPAVDAKIPAGGPVRLSWMPVQGVRLYRVQLGDSLSFEERLLDRTVKRAEVALPAVEPGKTYAWRVASIDQVGHEGEFGFARRFSINRAPAEPRAPAVEASPPDDHRVEVTGVAPRVHFRWSGEGKAYRLVLARDAELKERVVTRKVNGTQTFLQDLRPGVYYWGVMKIVGPGRGKEEPLFPGSRRLIIGKRRPPDVRVPKTIKWQ